MNIQSDYELSLGSLTLPEPGSALHDESAVALEKGNWNERIRQRNSARRSIDVSARRARLAGNCFADPTRIRIGGAR
jgi:hypothetical protein